MKKIKILVAILIVVGLFAYQKPKSDHFIRHTILQLSNTEGRRCTGENVYGASGKKYVITAGHCSKMIENGAIKATDESGNEYSLAVIGESPDYDLMLLEGIEALPALRMAKSLERFQHVRTFSHGMGLKTYSTEGVVVDEYDVEAPVFQIEGPDDLVHCRMYPNKHKMAGSLFGMLCILNTKATVVTAWMVAGSSGGAVVDDRGDLVGIISATKEHFGFIVPFADVQAFLSDK